ncbi:MAG: hypothetical protein ABL891_19380 [Burkholderiales bacterium]
MRNLEVLARSMKLAIEIDGFEPSVTYRCDKCSNKKESEVRHPKATFRVIDAAMWSKPLGGTPFLYLLTAVHPKAQKEAPRYVGIAKASCLMRRWTRMPDSERHNFPDGTLIHHMAATVPRLGRDFSDPGFREISGLFRLYTATVRDIIFRLSKIEGHEWPLPTAMPNGLSAEYSSVENFETHTVAEMYKVGLVPWNDTRGLTAAPSSLVLARNLAFSVG